MARKRKNKNAPAESEDEEIVHKKLAAPDPTSEEYFNDEIEQFNLKKDKILLEDGVDVDGESSDGYLDEGDEVMQLDVDQGSSASDGEEEKELGSNDEQDESDDDDDDESDEESGLPSTKAWGRKKKQFYSSDVIDIDRFAHDEEEERAAEQEEKEAISLQQRMMSGLSQEDFDHYEVEEKPSKDHEELMELGENKSRITKDLSKLSKEEKIQILVEESPELFELLDDYQSKLSEVINKYHPLLQLARNSDEISPQGEEFIELMHRLLLNYCVNINFYLALKANNESVKDHPVIETLVKYRNVISQFEPIAKKLEPELNEFLTKANEMKDSLEQDAKIVKPDQNTQLAFKKAKSAESIISKSKTKKRKVEKKNVSDSSKPDIDPIEYYNKIASELKAKKAKIKMGEEEDLDPSVDFPVGEADEDAKRAITYEMAKNKGLMRKRKKELRNPRVKHKMKFKRAIVKRKSQIPQLRNEAGSYGGEMTGIKSNVAKSVKLR